MANWQELGSIKLENNKVLNIPKFLKVKKKSLEEKEALLERLRKEGTQKRDWIMPDKNRPAPPPSPIFVDNRNAPVEVKRMNVEGKAETFLTFDNLEAFEKQHDRKTYPISRVMSNNQVTYILVTSKPWAKENKGEPAAPKPRKVRDYSRTGEGKPLRRDSSLGEILTLMLAGKHTFPEIVKLSGVEGGVISAEDKVAHRMKVILHGQHGIGHSADDKGVITAFLPDGFTVESIFAKKEKKAAVAPSKPADANNAASVKRAPPSTGKGKPREKK